MAKYVELRRHTDNVDDALSPDGVRVALGIGARLHGDYELLVSTGAQRPAPMRGRRSCAR